MRRLKHKKADIDGCKSETSDTAVIVTRGNFREDGNYEGGNDATMGGKSQGMWGISIYLLSRSLPQVIITQSAQLEF